MQSLCYFTFSLLCSLSLLPSGLSLQCKVTQYEWPTEIHKWCCDMCQPGQYMEWRDPASCKIKCLPCPDGRYNQNYTRSFRCNLCSSCNGAYMEEKFKCNGTHDTVCQCIAGYKCQNKSCSECRPIQTTTKPTLPPSTTTTPGSYKPLRDSVWFLVIIALLCVGIALVVVTKIKPFLHWIRSHHGYIFAEKLEHQPPCAEDEEVSKPVQEVCGKCDQLIGVSV